MGHCLPHALGEWRGVLPLMLPFGAFGYFVVLKFVHRGVAGFALNGAVAPCIDHPWYLAIPRYVCAIVPFIPIVINCIRH